TRAGIGHSSHPNIDKSGSVAGMRAGGGWHRSDRVVLSHGFYFNISRVVIRGTYDQIAHSECRCGLSGGIHAANDPPRPEATADRTLHREQDARTIREARALLSGHALQLGKYRGAVQADSARPNVVCVVFTRRRTGAMIRLPQVHVDADGA